MQHIIQTNIKTALSAEYRTLQVMIDDVRSDHGLRLVKNAFKIIYNGNTYEVKCKCNGAALRDLVSAFDRAGFLD